MTLAVEDEMKTIIAAIMIALLELGCTTVQPAITAKQRGEQRAQADIASGRMHILHYGKPWSTGKPLKDDDTGLPVEIVAGCAVTSDCTEEIDAYNQIMRDAARQQPRK